MIGRFFNWLGDLIARFFTWAVGVFIDWLSSLIKGGQGLLDWGTQMINDFGGDILSYALTLLPPDSPAQRSLLSGAAVFRQCWVIGDAYVPLTEGMFLVTAYFTFYISIKVTFFIIRIVLDLF